MAVHADWPDRDDWPVHQPPAYDAPIPGRHWYAGCEPGGDYDPESGTYEGTGPRVGPDGICEGCGQRACPVCGHGFYGPGDTGCACPDPPRSEGHIAFAGRYEYVRVGDAVYSAPVAAPVQTNGLRGGLRWEGTIGWWREHGARAAGVAR